MATLGPRPCPACRSNDSRSAGEIDGFGLQRCRACRTLFTESLPATGDSVDYDDYYHDGNLEVPEFVGQRIADNVAELSPYRKLGRWLDIGCGAGTLLDAVIAAGWEAVGSEVSFGAVNAARARGLDVRHGDASALDLGDGSFDVVSMVEVLEHVPEPHDQIEAAFRLLRPGGALYATTPHGAGISARLLGPSWSVVAPPEHLQLFSVSGMRTALESAGFRVRRLRAQTVNPTELMSRLRRSGQPVRGNERVESSYRLNEALTSTGTGTLLKRTVNSGLALTRLGDSLRVIAERPA